MPTTWTILLFIKLKNSFEVETLGHFHTRKTAIPKPKIKYRRQIHRPHKSNIDHVHRISPIIEVGFSKLNQGLNLSIHLNWEKAGFETGFTSYKQQQLEPFAQNKLPTNGNHRDNLKETEVLIISTALAIGHHASPLQIFGQPTIKPRINC